MTNTECEPFVECGKVFNPVLPLQLTEDDPPVVLTQVFVNTEKIKDANVLINFSGFIATQLREERFGKFRFRLQKCYVGYSHSETLMEWPFTREFVNDTNIKEPIVFNFCDNISSNKRFSYKFELISVDLSEKSSYNIIQKSMTAQIFCK
ncbi:DUF4489 domain-containing protein [Cytobacillus sp. Hm23]